MATNRYTDLTPAQFNPLSVQEIMMVPLAKQRQHELQQQQLSEMGIFDVNRLQVDDDLVQSNIDSYKKEISSIQDELLNKGINRNLTRKLIDLKSKRDQFLSNDGIGGRAKQQYDLYQKNVKDVLSNKDLSREQQELGLRWALNNYKGLENDSTYNPYVGANYVDINQKALDFAGKMKPQVIEKLAYEQGWKDIGDGMAMKGTIKVSKLDPRYIASVVTPYLQGDREVSNYINDLNTISGRDNSGLLSNAVLNAVNQQQQYDYYDNRDVFNLPKDTGSGKDDEDNTNISTDVRTLPVITDAALYDSTELRNVGKPGMFGTEDIHFSLGDVYAPGLASEKEPTPIEKYKGELWNKIGKKLIGENADLSNPEHAGIVADYLDEIGNEGYGNLNVSILDPTMGVVAGVSEGSISKNRVAFEEYANKRKHNAKFVDEQGNFYNNWSDVSEKLGVDVKANFDNVNGVVNFDNMLPELVPSDYKNYKDDFISPISVIIYDKDNKPHTLYMSRSEGDISLPSNLRKAQKELRDEFVEMQNLPTLPTKVRIYNNETGREDETDMAFYPKKLFLEKELLPTLKDVAGVDVTLLHGDTIETKLRQLQANPGLMTGIPDPEVREGITEIINKYLSIGSNEGLFGYYPTEDGQPLYNYDVKDYVTKEELITNKYQGRGIK